MGKAVPQAGSPPPHSVHAQRGEQARLVPSRPGPNSASVQVEDAPSFTVLFDGLITMFRPGRLREVMGGLPLVAKMFLIYNLVADIVVAVVCFLKNAGDEKIFRRLIVVYCVFQYLMAVHSIYTQNEYTLAAAWILIAIECLFVTLDWQDTYTGFDYTPLEVGLHWGNLAIALGLSVATYRSLEGFGWRPYRELGCLEDALAVHAAYRYFSAALSFDFFASFMHYMLSLTFVSWPSWLVALETVFCAVAPFVLYMPLRKSVKHEWITLLKWFACVYALGAAVEITVLVYSVLEQVGDCAHSRLTKGSKFPVAGVLVASSSAAVIVRLFLLWRLYMVVTLGKGKGLLRELGVRRSLHRDVYCSAVNSRGTYGTQRSMPTESATRYDFQYRIDDDDAGPLSSGLPVRQSASPGQSLPTHASPSLAPYTALTPSAIHNESLGGISGGAGGFVVPGSGGTACTPDETLNFTPSLGPVPILTAKTVTLDDSKAQASTARE